MTFNPFHSLMVRQFYTYCQDRERDKQICPSLYCDSDLDNRFAHDCWSWISKIPTS